MVHRKGDRVHIIDGLRGIAIVGMVFHHTLFDLNAIFGVDIKLLDNPWFLKLLTFGAGLFIFLSGISSRFSKRNLKRGIKIFLFGMFLTVLTLLFFKEQVIYFGILHFLGLAIILYSLLKPWLDKLDQLLILIGGGILFDISFYIYSLGYNADFFLSFLLGFPSPAFSTSDYFPIFPWFFLFLSGTGFGLYVVENRLPAIFYKFKLPGFEFVGRNTLWIYLLHQPVIIAVLWLSFKITGKL